MNGNHIKFIQKYGWIGAARLIHISNNCKGIFERLGLRPIEQQDQEIEEQ